MCKSESLIDECDNLQAGLQIKYEMITHVISRFNSNSSLACFLQKREKESNKCAHGTRPESKRVPARAPTVELKPGFWFSGFGFFKLNFTLIF